MVLQHDKMETVSYHSLSGPSSHLLLNLGSVFNKKTHMPKIAELVFALCSLSSTSFYHFHVLFSKFNIFVIGTHLITNGYTVISNALYFLSGL
jgi:hypothetical protein